MEQEQIDREFNQFFFKMSMIDKRVDGLETQFKIAYQEGIIKGQQYVIDKFKSHA